MAKHFQNARAAARCNIATKSANERIGVQEGTKSTKNANDWVRRKEGEQKQSSIRSQNTVKNHNEIFDPVNNFKYLCLILFQIGVCLSKCERVPSDATTIFFVLRRAVLYDVHLHDYPDLNHAEDRELCRAPFSKRGNHF